MSDKFLRNFYPKPTSSIYAGCNNPSKDGILNYGIFSEYASYELYWRIKYAPFLFSLAPSPTGLINGPIFVYYFTY